MSKQHIVTEETQTEFTSPAAKYVSEKLNKFGTFLITKTTKTVLTKRVVVSEE
jgi:hypothetical protein